MKRKTWKEWMRDVKRGILNRKKVRRKPTGKQHDIGNNVRATKDAELRDWLIRKQNAGLRSDIHQNNQVVLHLPEELDFYKNYEITALYMNAIRKLAPTRNMLRGNRLRLANVNLDKVQRISTSASLVLTAELSRWDDHISNKLRSADTSKWSPQVLEQLVDVGFFDIFPSCANIQGLPQFDRNSNIRLVKYIKGRQGDNDKHRELKEKITTLVGADVPKWTFLATGISEAITNVGHHAYPDLEKFEELDKNWYMGGSFDRDSKDLKIVFYDQGVSIPRSLPTSGIYEKIVEQLTKVIPIGKYKDEMLLKAAVELTRTSTNDTDRGKGLQDLLNFIDQRGDGYISILSRRALFKYKISDGHSKIKTMGFRNPINGTLILWKVNLSKK